MAKREDFRKRVDFEHRPRYSPLRLIIFIMALGACAYVGYATFALVSKSPTSGATASNPGIDLSRVSSVDQLVLTFYLRLRLADVEARSNGRGDVPFTVQSGDTPATIGARLQKLGLIQDADLFRQVTKARGVESRLEAGDYILQRGTTMDEILLALQHGVETPNTVRVIEGQRVEEVAALLGRQGIATSADFIAAAKAGVYSLPELKDRPAGSTLEG